MCFSRGRFQLFVVVGVGVKFFLFSLLCGRWWCVSEEEKLIGMHGKLLERSNENYLGVQMKRVPIPSFQNQLVQYKMAIAKFNKNIIRRFSAD